MKNIILQDTALQNKLAAISTAIENARSGLFASDISLNVKMERYFPVTSAGEVTPFAYDEAGTAKAFIGLLADIAESGQDFQYQPQLGISDDLQGHKALIFTRWITPTDDAKSIVRLIPEALSFDELLHTIEAEIEATGAKIVIIDDVAGDARRCGNAILWDLNELADRTNVLLFAGFMLSHEAADEVSSWLARHAHNLLQLTAGSLNMKNDDGETCREQPYLCISYGNPVSMRIYYGIAEDGSAFIPSGLWKMLRIKEAAKMFAGGWVSVKLFTHEAFGFLQGAFQLSSLQKAIDEAAACGIIQKSGQRTKAKLILSDGKMSRSTNVGSIALTALGNPYTAPNRTKQRRPILRFGQFKLLAPENGAKANTVRSFAFNMMGAIVTGKKWLDFDVKSPYRNTLAIIVGTDERGAKWAVDRISTFGDGAKFDALALNQGTTDGEFLSEYKQAVDAKKPDFIFVLCYDRITPNLYTAAQLAHEIAIYSKSKGICTVGVSEREVDRVTSGLGDELWTISPLVTVGDMEEIREMFGIRLRPISSFNGSSGTFDFICRFVCFEDFIFEVSGKEQKLSRLIGTFYWCDDTQCCQRGDCGADTISTDCTGQPLTNSIIFQAQKAGLIKVRHTSERMKLLESRITFNAEAAKLLTDKV